MKIYVKNTFRLICIILAALLAVSALAGCSRSKTNSPDIKNVKVQKTAKSSISLTVEYAGKVKPLQEVTIASKLSGKVASVNADIGSEVRKGQVLFTLDTKLAAAELQQSKAAIDNARANLTRVNDSSKSQQLIQLQELTDQAQIQYDDAKRLYEKTQSLYNAGAASRQQLDDAESAFKNAGFQLSSAQQNLKLFNEKAADQSTAIAASQLEQAQAAYEVASIQVDDSTVTAPIDGTISMRSIDEGEIISAGLSAFTIVNSKTIIIEINVPDTVIEKIKTGQQVPVGITALPDLKLQGTIAAISPAADSRTQAYLVKLRLDNSSGTVKPGMLAKVLLPMESKTGVLTVPDEAIFVEDGVQYVFVVRNGKLEKKTVTTGLSNDSITEVTGGLTEGDAVVLEGQSFLNDGETVNISK